MDFQTYYPLALRTAKNFPEPQDNLEHALLGLCTEVGELATEVKRITIYGKPMTEEMRQHMVEEVGDALWYLPLLLRTLGFNGQPPEQLQDDELLSRIGTDLKGSTLGLNSIQGTLSGFDLLGLLFNEREQAQALVWGFIQVVDGVVAPALGTTGDDIRAQNIAKLQLRYPDAYSDQAAEARADKGGLAARES